VYFGIPFPQTEKMSHPLLILFNYNIRQGCLRVNGVIKGGRNS
jgi:hypothetical protein